MLLLPFGIQDDAFLVAALLRYLTTFDSKPCAFSDVQPYLASVQNPEQLLARAREETDKALAGPGNDVCQ